MKDTDLMPFGKHKGKAMVNVPAQYLLWLWENIYKEFCNDLSPEVCKYIHSNLQALKIEAAKNNRFLSR